MGNIEGAKPPRVAILVASAREFDVAKLARHLAATSRGAASVARLSIGKTRPGGATVDYASICEKIWKLLDQRSASDPGTALGLAGPEGDASTTGPQLILAQSSPPPATTVNGTNEGSDREIIVPALGARVDREARGNPGCELTASVARDSIAVIIAPDRTALPSAWLARLAGEPGIQLFHEPVAGPALLASHVERCARGVLLLDKTMFDQLDPGCLQAMRARLPKLRVLLSWDEAQDGMVEAVLRNHFDGLLPASCPPEVCVKAIRAVSRGELWLPRALLASAIFELSRARENGRAAMNNDSSACHASALTRRERQIVEFLHRGLTNKEIAWQLGIKEDTVKKHLQGVFGKLGVHRRALVVLHQAGGRSAIA